MALVITSKDGSKRPYSEKQFRADNPSAIFPKGLVGVDLAQYGVSLEPDTKASVSTPERDYVLLDRVPMHLFLYGLREFGLRVQFEAYILAQQGHARDFWLTAPYVCRESTYVQHAAAFFGLSKYDLDQIFYTASSVEE